jgi:hypothetical protein
MLLLEFVCDMHASMLRTQIDMTNVMHEMQYMLSYIPHHAIPTSLNAIFTVELGCILNCSLQPTVKVEVLNLRISTVF